MNTLPPYLHWFALAALGDWLIVRTLTRTAIHIPKSPAVVTVFQGVSLIGQFAATLTSLLALLTLGWMIAVHLRHEQPRGLAVVCVGLLLLSIRALFVAPLGWLAVSYHALALTALALIMLRLWQIGTPPQLFVGTATAITLIVVEFYQIAPALYEAMQWSGPPPFSGTLFNLGEIWVVLTPAVWWWAYGRGASRRVWAAAALPALAFFGMHISDPSMTGILSIWSTGLSLFLPPSVYALSLWLAGVTLIMLLRCDAPLGCAFLLLAAGGYVPQLSTHLLLGLIALWVVTVRYRVQHMPVGLNGVMTSMPA